MGFAILGDIGRANEREYRRREAKRKQLEEEQKALERYRLDRQRKKEWLKQVEEKAASQSDGSQQPATEEPHTIVTKGQATMLDLEDFKTRVLNPFMEKTKYAADKTKSARKGSSIAAEDAANGYMDGDKLSETLAKMNSRRIETQRDFKTVCDQYEADAADYVKRAFRIDAQAVAELAPVLSVLGANEGDYASLAEQYSGNYSALRAIAGTAERNGCEAWGKRLNAALSDYQTACSDVLVGGISLSASRGVLGQVDLWDTAVSMKLDKVASARTELDYVTGAQERPVSGLQEVINEYAYLS